MIEPYLFTYERYLGEGGNKVRAIVRFIISKSRQRLDSEQKQLKNYFLPFGANIYRPLIADFGNK